MATLTSKEIIDQVIEANGTDPDGVTDFDIMKIVQYTTPEGDPNNWGVVFRCEVGMGIANRYETSFVCLEPKVIWTRKE